MSSSRLRSCRHALVAAVAAGAACLAMPGIAGAVKVQRIYAGPVTAASSCNPDGNGVVPALAAARYTDFCFALRTERTAPAGDDLKSTIIDSPRGVLANVDVEPQCTVAAFAAGSTKPAACAPDTQVGVSTASIRAQLAPGVEIPLQLKGRVYNLTHTNEELGILGIQLDPTLAGLSLPKSKILLRFSLRSAPDVGLRGVAEGLPRVADTGLGGSLKIAIDTFTFRFWGSKADHPSLASSFTRTGSACDTSTTRFSGVSYGGDTSELESSYQGTGCDQLKIGQSATVTTTERRPDVPTETQVNVLPEIPADTLRDATVNPRTSVVALPPGLMLGAQGASGPGGLPLCSNAAFALESNVPPSCPAGSAVGTVKFISPSLKVPFIGNAYLGAQTGPNRLPQLMIMADQGGTQPNTPRVKLLGQLTIDPEGRLVTTLSGLPDVPFDSFLLTFRGGEHGVTSTPRACGTGVGSSQLIPQSPDTPPSTVPLTLTIDQDCVDDKQFSPSLTAAFTSTVAGGSGAPTFTIARADRTARLSKAVIHLAPGMLASLKGVPECPAALAAQGACPDTSRVGTTSVQAGVGPAPDTTPAGKVFLTERPPGAVAGLSIVSEAAFGEVDLGPLIVPGRIDLRPGDYGLDLTTEIPSTFLDIPLGLRSLAVTLDRPGFSKNPTSCAPLTVTGDFGSDRATVASASAPAQMTGCDALPFAPQIQATFPAGTKVGDAAGMTVKIALPGNQSAMRRVQVSLPPGIGADLTRVGRACPVAEFRATGCTDAAVTGRVDGSLAILDEPIAGRVVLVNYPGEVLPGIGLDIAGRFNARIEGRVKVLSTGQLGVTLDGIPDAPITDLTMTLAPGASSVLKVSSLFCPKGTAAFAFDIAAQSGAQVKPTVSTPCGAGAVLSTRVRRANLSLRLTGRASGTPALALTATGPSKTRLRSVTLQLPRGMSVDRRRARTTAVRGGRLQATSGRTLRVTLRGTGRRTAKAQLRGGTLQLQSAVRRSKARLALRVTLRYADGVVERRTVRVR